MKVFFFFLSRIFYFFVSYERFLTKKACLDDWTTICPYENNSSLFDYFFLGKYVERVKG